MLGSILTSIESQERRKGKEKKKPKPKIKGKSSKTQHDSSPPPDDSNIEIREHDNDTGEPIPEANAGVANGSQVGGKRPRSSSSTRADQSGPQPSKKAKQSEPSHAPGSSGGIAYFPAIPHIN